MVFPFRRAPASIEYAVFRRSDSLVWQCVAGGGEEAETPLRAAQREALEEAGIPTSSRYFQLRTETRVPVSCIHVSARAHWPRDLYVIPNFAFATEVEDSTEIELSREHTTFIWCGFEEAHEKLRYDDNKTALWELNERIADGTLHLCV
jgi:dATP pyrophosphohydrolase